MKTTSSEKTSPDKPSNVVISSDTHQSSVSSEISSSFNQENRSSISSGTSTEKAELDPLSDKDSEGEIDLHALPPPHLRTDEQLRQHGFDEDEIKLIKAHHAYGINIQNLFHDYDQNNPLDQARKKLYMGIFKEQYENNTKSLEIIDLLKSTIKTFSGSKTLASKIYLHCLAMLRENKLNATEWGRLYLDFKDYCISQYQTMGDDKSWLQEDSLKPCIDRLYGKQLFSFSRLMSEMARHQVISEMQSELNAEIEGTPSASANLKSEFKEINNILWNFARTHMRPAAPSFEELLSRHAPSNKEEISSLKRKTDVVEEPAAKRLCKEKGTSFNTPTENQPQSSKVSLAQSSFVLLSSPSAASSSPPSSPCTEQIEKSSEKPTNEPGENVDSPTC